MVNVSIRFPPPYPAEKPRIFNPKSRPAGMFCVTVFFLLVTRARIATEDFHENNFFIVNFSPVHDGVDGRGCIS